MSRDNSRLERHYVNHTADKRSVEVEGKTFTIVKLPADLALRLSVRVGTTVAPIIPLLGKDVNITDALPKLNLDDEKLSDFVIDVVEMCQIENRMVRFDGDIEGLAMPFKLAFEFLKFNFESFFANSPLAKKAEEAVGGINLGEMMPT